MFTQRCFPLCALLVVCFAVAARGQPPMTSPYAEQAPRSQPVPVSEPVDALEVAISTPPVSRVYAGADYMLWWVKGAPLSVPLVSTGPISTTHHGWLDRPDSTILYGSPFPGVHGGNDTQTFPAFSGGRVTLGYSLDDEQRFAIEGSAFGLQKRSAGYKIRSDSSGLPVVNIPVYNTIPYSPLGRSIMGMSGLPPSEDGLPASLPSDPTRFDGNTGVFMGGVKITNSLRLWGTDVSGLVNLFRGSSLDLSGVVGFRYLDLSETFNLVYDSAGVSGSYQGQYGVASDTFQTRNHFYGGILGLRGRYLSGPLSVDLTARVAMGSSHEVQNVWGGFYSYYYIKLYMTGTEGVFAQPANEGRRSANNFAVVPDVQLRLGYALTPRLRLTMGYDFLYYSSVLRPGDQINRNLPKGQTFQQGQVPASTTNPVPLFNTTSFYAQGVSFGLDFHY